MNVKKSFILILVMSLLVILFSNSIAASDLNESSLILSDDGNQVLLIDDAIGENEGDEEIPVFEGDELYVDGSIESSGDGSRDNPLKTVSEAVDIANTGIKAVSIYILQGTYSETNMTLKNNLTISSFENDEVVLDANKKGWFFYSDNADNTLTIKGLTFTNGENYDYDNSTVGGVVKTEGHINVINCSFTNNHGGTGAAVNSHNGANIVNSTFENNKAEYGGGAVYVYGNVTNIVNSTFKSNLAKNQGGAVRIQGDLNIFNSIFDNNTADTKPFSSNGGAVRQTDGNLTVEGSTFTNNYAKVQGGAISAGDDDQYSTNHYSVNINNSTFTDNKAVYGGAIVANDGLILTNSVISNNSESSAVSARYGEGSGVYVLNGDTTLVGNTIEGNGNSKNSQTKDIVVNNGAVSAKDNDWGDSDARIKFLSNGELITDFEYVPTPIAPISMDLSTGGNGNNQGSGGSSDGNQGSDDNSGSGVPSDDNPISTEPSDDVPVYTEPSDNDNGGGESTQSEDFISQLIDKVVDAINTITNNQGSNSTEKKVENSENAKTTNTTEDDKISETTKSTIIDKNTQSSVGKDSLDMSKDNPSKSSDSKAYNLSQKDIAKAAKSGIPVIVVAIIIFALILIGYYRRKDDDEY